MKRVIANSILLMFLFGMLVTPVASVGLLKIPSANQEVLSAHSRKTVDVEDQDSDNNPVYYDIRNEVLETTQATEETTTSEY